MLYSLLKAGGILGISDHIGDDGNDNAALHRMPEQQAIALARDAGFEVTSSDLLRVHSDDHSRSVFDPRLARATDRFLLRLLKPAR
jgi:predicted methyltransferase